ncbi:MAG: hypothetical protein ACI8PG_003159, partial [Planctomycetota bacterium]
ETSHYFKYPPPLTSYGFFNQTNFEGFPFVE